MNFSGFKFSPTKLIMIALGAILWVLLLCLFHYYLPSIFSAKSGNTFLLILFAGLSLMLFISIALYEHSMIKDNHKKILNFSLVFVLALIELFIVHLIYTITPDDFKFYDNKTRTIIGSAYQFIPIVLILGWTGILIGYYAWSIYFYNIQYGYTNEQWQKLRQEVDEAKLRKSLGESVPEVELQLPKGNPYKDETFGLPSGTVRGTIALSLVVGGFALLIFSMNPNQGEANERFIKLFEFFTQAYIMMIAFYFGNSSLKYLTDRSKSIFGMPVSNSSTPNTKDANSMAEEIKPKQSVESNQIVNNVDDDKDEIEKIIEKRTSVGADEDEEQPVQAIANKQITKDDILKAAERIGVEPAAIKAVIAVESLGKGFLPDQRPIILFEGHVFYSFLKQKGLNVNDLATKYPTIVYPNWVKTFYKKGSEEYLRFEAAKKIDKDSAIKSTSFGLFQVMGFNHSACGFSDLSSFIEAMYFSEGKQLEAFVNFISTKKTKEGSSLASLLKNKSWAQFAYYYNGAGYKRNNYDVKLEEAYAKFDSEENPVLNMQLKRIEKLEKETLGELKVLRGQLPIFTCKTLELPDLNNQKRISCIPIGEYWVSKRYNDKLGNHFHVEDVPNRDWILIHSGNKYTQILGCILVGDKYADIDNDGIRDIINSRATLAKLYEIMPKKFKLKIENA